MADQRQREPDDEDGKVNSKREQPLQRRAPEARGNQGQRCDGGRRRDGRHTATSSPPGFATTVPLLT
jgi:hypothetical protein